MNAIQWMGVRLSIYLACIVEKLTIQRSLVSNYLKSNQIAFVL